MDEDNDLAKPISGTNEIQIYDKKTRSLIKKKVNYDKTKLKFLYFYNGCRNVLIKDRLYITGGVDKENKQIKICYVDQSMTKDTPPTAEDKEKIMNVLGKYQIINQKKIII